jgi:hypothetical protein
LNVPVDTSALPRDVQVFLDEADRRIEQFQIEHHIPGFVPSDFARAYGMLRTVAESDLAQGNLFCEWGSGFGVVACLATMLDFNAHGIEIERELVDAARRLATDFDLPVEFAQGSFIPTGSEIELDDDGFSWLTVDGNPPAEMDLGPDDFSLIFAYPWPDEQCVIKELFERHAANGALLLTYHSDEYLRLRRKEGQKRRPRKGTVRK